MVYLEHISFSPQTGLSSFDILDRIMRSTSTGLSFLIDLRSSIYPFFTEPLPRHTFFDPVGFHCKSRGERIQEQVTIHCQTQFLLQRLISFVIFVKRRTGANLSYS